MSPHAIVSPSHSSPDVDRSKPDSEADPTTDTQPTRANSTVTSDQSGLSLRGLATVGGLFVAYVVALTAIGVVRALRWPFRCIRNRLNA